MADTNDPPLPVLPDDFTTHVEANFVAPSYRKSYTLNRREYYSTTYNAERIEEHSSHGTVIQIRNFTTDIVYQLQKNAAHPNGFCTASPMSKRSLLRNTNADHTHLVGTAQFLNLGKDFHGNDLVEIYEGGGHDVRGIPCEKWSHQITFPAYVPHRNGTNATDTGATHSAPENNTFSVEHYFPEAQWQDGRRRSGQGEPANYLHRITLNGTARGEHVLHLYEFMDFKAIPEDEGIYLFDPCQVYDGSRMEGNCSCSHGKQCNPFHHSPFVHPPRDIHSSNETSEGGHDDDDDASSKMGAGIVAVIALACIAGGMVLGIVLMHIHKQAKESSAPHFPFVDEVPQSKL
ncbi:hypothetical protein CYMTET_23322 [Cymbomonas tetramitiformis]|uniref:LolA-like domain-containing protein n=1 Tax=Cymbomonas tetramitiformis TaxID=36881 RepID=A0AAE0FZM2_9CHLO|nr:hypothetical protein CYMTET_23322 [Cymbomonas tetramitiformis]